MPEFATSKISLAATIGLMVTFLRGRLAAIRRAISELEDAAIIAIAGSTNMQRVRELWDEADMIRNLIEAYDRHVTAAAPISQA